MFARWREESGFYIHLSIDYNFPNFQYLRFYIRPSHTCCPWLHRCRRPLSPPTPMRHTLPRRPCCVVATIVGRPSHREDVALKKMMSGLPLNILIWKIEHVFALSFNIFSIQFQRFTKIFKLVQCKC